MSNKMKFALTIAGFDGSAGAGILADVKAMAHFGVYCESVCTALTQQNEDEFVAPGWVIWDRIEAQLETLFKKRTFKYVKIGLVEKAKVLKKIVEYIRTKSPDAYIIWDPIASASAGTPNQDEFGFLGLGLAASRGLVNLGNDFALLLKGGHSRGKEAVDILWDRDGKQYKFSSPRLPGHGKHGTGCHLSSAILANLALGHTLPESCQIAKNYLTELLQSGEGRLAKDI